MHSDLTTPSRPLWLPPQLGGEVRGGELAFLDYEILAVASQSVAWAEDLDTQVHH